MGRPRKTDRIDDVQDQQVDSRDREPERDDFENEMFSDTLASPLYIPPDRWPQDQTLRWIRIEAGNAADNANWSKMTRLGWTPVKRSVYADLFPTVPMPGQGDVTEGSIVFGGLCLCQRPTRLVMRDKAAQEKATREAGRTIESYVEGGTANAPRFNQSGPTEYQRSRGPAQFKE